MKDRFPPSGSHKQMLRECLQRAEAAEALNREKDARIAELEKDRDLNMEMYQSAWKKYASCANALSFYAKRIHWMGLTEDAEVETVLVAMQGPSPCHGWSVAERALSAPSQTYELERAVVEAVGYYVDAEESFNAINASHPEEREWDIRRVQVNNALQLVRQRFRALAKAREKADD